MTFAQRAAFGLVVFIGCWPFLLLLHYVEFPDMFSGIASASITAGFLVKHFGRGG